MIALAVESQKSPNLIILLFFSFSGIQLCGKNGIQQSLNKTRESSLPAIQVYTAPP